jgi:hypothetical protein
MDHAYSYTSAVMKYNESYYDIVILDLRIPINDGGMPEFTNSARFLEFIKSSAVYRPFLVSGLSSYDASHYEGVALDIPITKFDMSNTEWLDRLIVELKNILSGKERTSQVLRQ